MKLRYLLAAGFLILAGAVNYYFKKLPEKQPIVKSALVQQTSSLEQKINNIITIASFNIQTFGKKKSSKPEIMNSIAKIIRKYDIVAIQEIRDRTQTTDLRLVNQVNKKETKYEIITSKRLGRTQSKEQYAFIYNTNKVAFTGNSYIYDDKNDLFEREPFIAQFKSGNFDYILVNIHIKPSDADNEIKALVDVVNKAKNKYEDDKDVIVLGDFNADGSYFSETTTTGLRSKIYNWVITDNMDTTVAKNNFTYDRIVFLKQFTNEDFAGTAGVFVYEKCPSKARKISDHWVVFADFYTTKDTD